MITRFFLLRHGPTHAKTMVGWSDLPADLSDTETLKRIRQRLPASALVISSDLQRAVATADAVQDSRERLPHDPNLREIHFGDWEQRSWAEIDAEDPDACRAYFERPGDIAPPQGESWNALRARVDQAMDRLLQRHRGQDLIIVGHFGQILTQIQRAKSISSAAVMAHSIDNLSVTEIHHDGQHWTPEAINQQF